MDVIFVKSLQISCRISSCDPSDSSDTLPQNFATLYKYTQSRLEEINVFSFAVGKLRVYHRYFRVKVHGHLSAKINFDLVVVFVEC